MDQRQIGGIVVKGMDMVLGDRVSLGWWIWGLGRYGVRGHHW